jgi:hypothetical protein
MNFPITSFEGVGPFKLGMTAEEIRRAVNSPVSSFKKSPQSEMLTDAFDLLGIHVFYKKPGICEAVELFSPSIPTFRDYRLIGQPFSRIASFFKQQDEQVELESAGLTSHKFGIAIYAPSAQKVPDDPIESVLIFAKHYYD